MVLDSASGVLFWCCVNQLIVASSLSQNTHRQLLSASRKYCNINMKVASPILASFQLLSAQLLEIYKRYGVPHNKDDEIDIYLLLYFKVLLKWYCCPT